MWSRRIPTMDVLSNFCLAETPHEEGVVTRPQGTLKIIDFRGERRAILCKKVSNRASRMKLAELLVSGEMAARAHGLATEGLSGTDAAICVPCVGRDRILSTPPTIRNRSCILRIPRPTVAEVVAKLNPEPLSERDRRIASAFPTSRTWAREAPLCFFTLRRPS